MLEKRQLPLAALRAFEGAARHLHMGRAGEELGVTHGAISHHVRTLETLLNTALFRRGNRRLRLTAAGERLYQGVRDGLELMVEGTMHPDTESMVGALTIGCTQTFAISWAIKHIGEFHARFPQVDVHLVELQPRQKKIPRSVDIALCYGEPSIDVRRVELLCVPPLFPVCSPRLLHGKHSVMRAGDIANMPLLHDKENGWPQWFLEMDVPQLKNVQQMFFANTALCLNAARHGFGVALCNTFEIQEDLREGALRQLLVEPIREAHNYYLVADHAKNQSLRARLFEEWIKHAVNRFEQEGDGQSQSYAS